MSGLTADAKTMIDKARVEAQVCTIFVLHDVQPVQNLIHRVLSIVSLVKLLWATNHLIVTLTFGPNDAYFEQSYWFTYNEPMPTESVTQAVCNLAMQFGETDSDSSMVSTSTSRSWLFSSCIYMLSLPTASKISWIEQFKFISLDVNKAFFTFWYSIM